MEHNIFKMEKSMSDQFVHLNMLLIAAIINPPACLIAGKKKLHVDIIHWFFPKVNGLDNQTILLYFFPDLLCSKLCYVNLCIHPRHKPFLNVSAATLGSVFFVDGFTKVFRLKFRSVIMF